MPRITGYAFNASITCPACTTRRWDAALILDAENPITLDEHGLPDNMTCRGEPVHPVFSTDEDRSYVCDFCQREVE